MPNETVEKRLKRRKKLPLRHEKSLNNKHPVPPECLKRVLSTYRFLFLCFELDFFDSFNGLRSRSMALGQAWTPPGSSINSKPRCAKCLKSRTVPQRQVQSAGVRPSTLCY